MSRRTRQSGVGLITAVFLVAILAVVGVSFALISTSQQISSARSLMLTRAYYAARGGIDEALAKARDGDCNDVPGSTDIGDITVDLECEDEEIRERNQEYLVFTITALAVAGSKSSGTLVRRRLEVQATGP